MQTGYVTPLQWTRGKRQHVYVGDCSSIRIAYSLLLYAMTHMHDSTVRCVVRNGYGPKQGSIGESLGAHGQDERPCHFLFCFPDKGRSALRCVCLAVSKLNVFPGAHASCCN